MDFADLLARNASEALMLLSFTGAASAAIRWRRAVRHDFLLAFIVFLLGTSLRELPVYLGGMLNWSHNLILLSALARLVQVVGATMFVRASLKGECPPWAWGLLLAVILLIAWVI